ncbi:MAG: hypothetical protein CMJ72_07705 [Planctomycetaceae bacterium]|nr:hypothetical protein [Planctomycetaceae bacterium]HCK40806.1 hypothetical protein [Planctomycetaceae bacterium]
MESIDLTNKDEVIGLEQLGKSFGKIPVLRNVTLSIRQGVTGLLGPNGAGKSSSSRSYSDCSRPAHLRLDWH